MDAFPHPRESNLFSRFEFRFHTATNDISVLPHGVSGKRQRANWQLIQHISRKRKIRSGKQTISLAHWQLELTLLRALTFARIENHFFVNEGWMRDGQLIEEAHKIKHLPIAILQGRYDVVCPAKTSWDLYQALGGAKNDNVEYTLLNCGHSAHETALEEALVDAVNKFKSIKV
jgi:pimeloyl-ACP methyl ester carboxylesterase